MQAGNVDVSLHVWFSKLSCQLMSVKKRLADWQAGRLFS